MINMKRLEKSSFLMFRLQVMENKENNILMVLT